MLGRCEECAGRESSQYRKKEKLHRGPDYLRRSSGGREERMRGVRGGSRKSGF